MADSSNIVALAATGDVTTASAALRAVTVTAAAATATAVVRAGGSGGTVVLSLSAVANTSAVVDLHGALCVGGIHVTLTGSGALASVVYA